MKKARPAPAPKPVDCRQIVHLAPEGIWVLDAQGVTTLVNPKMAEMLGYLSEEIVGQPGLFFLEAAEIEKARQSFERCREGLRESYEFTFIRKDGQPLLAALGTAPLFDADGCFVGALAVVSDVTERRRAEKALQERAQRYQLLSRDAPMPIAIARIEDGAILYANRRGLEMFQITIEQALGVDVRTFWAFPEDRQDYARRLLADGRVTNYEARFRTGAGKVFWASITANLAEYEGQRAIFASIVDVTDRKDAEEALQKSEKLLKAVIEAIPLPVFFKDDQLRYRTFNQAFAEAFNVSREKLSGASVFDVSPPELAAVYDRADRELMRLRGRQAYQTQFRHADGSLREVMFYKSVVEDAQGDLEGLVGVMMDLTERIRAEEALERTSEELENFFDLTLDLLCIADTDGNFRKLNRAWETMLGYPLDELTGRRFFDFINPDDIAPTEAALATLSNQGDVYNFVNRYRCKDGACRWLEWRAHPKGVLVFAAARDITRHVTAEAELQKALEEKETLLRELQHRVKNSLAIIAALVGLEAGRSPEGRVRDALGKIRDQVTSLGKLYELLYRSNEIQTVSLDGYIREVATSLAESYASGEKPVDLRLDLSDVRIDLRRAIHLGIILNELLTNALKHAFPLGVKGIVQIVMTRTEDLLKLEISDNGIGTVPAPDGTGSSGLELVQMLAVQLRGTVESDRVEGTHYRITIPLAE